MNGLLVLDKPQGMTSRTAVNRALKWLPRKTKVGHTGTLDPMATGVLVLCVGSATRLTPYVQDLAKTYEACVRLGAFSDTDDADGQVEPVPGASPPAEHDVRTVLDSFLGEVVQIPPAFSAAKIAGVRAYERARRGEDVHLTARKVRIDAIEVLGFDYPELRLRIDCGKGTYIRSIARDLGTRLGRGGYLVALRRTRVGPFTPDLTIPLDADVELARKRILPARAAVCHLPCLRVSDEAERRLRTGQAVEMLPEAAALPEGIELVALDRSGEMIGLLKRDPQGRLAPTLILPGSQEPTKARETR